MRWLADNTVGDEGRFVALAPKPVGLQAELEAIGRIEYIPSALTMPASAANAWILFGHGETRRRKDLTND